MSDEDAEIDYKLAQRELELAIKQLQRIGSDQQQTRKSEPPYCSFCGKGKNEVAHMVKGITAYICRRCAAEANDVMEGLETDE